MNTRLKRPAFLSPVTMRRALQARLLSVDARARLIRKVTVERLGGFEDRSHKLRYHLWLRMSDHTIKRVVIRGTIEVQDETRRQAYEIMKFLWLHGFDRGPFQIPRPITFFRRWKLLLYQEAPGKSALDFLARRHQTEKIMALSGQWLAELHRHSPRTIRLAYNHRGRQHYWRAVLGLLTKEHEPDFILLRRGIQRIKHFEDRLARGRGRVLVHHDFHPGNIILSGQTLRVIDFSESRLSHPLIDIASFMIQLEMLLGRHVPQSIIKRWQHSFFRAYQGRTRKRLSLQGSSAQEIFNLMRFRLAFQAFVGAYVAGQKDSFWRREILQSPLL